MHTGTQQVLLLRSLEASRCLEALNPLLLLLLLLLQWLAAHL
jgi:hypothetical protein